jgi:hypothetical protein
MSANHKIKNMKTYNILKSYDSTPSKNKVEETGITLEKAMFQLDVNESLWRRHGGQVISRTDSVLICEESNGNEIITWSINEVEDENEEPVNSRYTYIDNVAGKQSVSFTRLSEIITYIENFGWNGDSEGIVYQDQESIFGYVSREDGLYWTPNN